MTPIMRKACAGSASAGPLLALLALLLPAAASAARETPSEAAAAQVVLLVRQIAAEPDAKARGDLACLLARSATKIQQVDVDTQLVDGIAGLLTDNEDEVQMCAAVALNNIGAPAARALPALDAATQTAFRKEYGDNPTAFGGTGLHTWDVLGGVAQRIRDAVSESP